MIQTLRGRRPGKLEFAIEANNSAIMLEDAKLMPDVSLLLLWLRAYG
jgi:hypothetical protein